jgi:hypothetical protein
MLSLCFECSKGGLHLLLIELYRKGITTALLRAAQIFCDRLFQIFSLYSNFTSSKKHKTRISLSSKSDFGIHELKFKQRSFLT